MRNLKFTYILIVIFFFLSCSKDTSKPDFENSSIKLLINEVMTYDSPNWIEIYNPNDTDINIEGFSIHTNNQIFIINSGFAPAKSYFLFFCDAQNFVNHTNFTLSNLGGKIWISDKENKIIDKISYPAINQSVSYGRIPDGSNNFVFITNPTPFSTNTPKYIPNQAPQIIEVSKLPEYPTENQNVIINIYAKDDYRIDSLMLFYACIGFDTVVNFNPSCCDPRKASAEIKGFPKGTNISYFIKAVDDSLLSTYFPLGAPLNKISYIVQ